MKKMLPFFAFLIFGSIAVFLWQNQNSHERELVLRHAKASSELIRVRIESLMNARIASLELLAHRWVQRTPPDFSKKRFIEFAEELYTRYPGFAKINWIDSGGVIRWIFPGNSNENVIDRSVYKRRDFRVRDTFQLAVENRKYIATPSVKLFQDGTGFDTFLPLIYADKVQGYLNGVFQVKQVVEFGLQRDIGKDFWVRFYEAGQLIYTSEKQIHMIVKKDKVQVVRKIHFPGKIWQLQLVAKPDLYPPVLFRHLQLLSFGLTIAAVLSLLLYFLLKRMQMYRKTRDRAIQEVRKRKHTENELKENKKKLEATLAQLSAKNTEIETFVYTVSHDLKSPIVTIEGFIGALREDFGNMIDKDGKKYLDYMGDATRKMSLLINDLLVLSRIGRLPEMKTEFSFGKLVEETIASFQHQIKKRGIKVTIEKSLPVIYGEKERLRQVMENLLSNAVKYIGEKNPSPRIDVGLIKQDEQKVFFVRDNGIGIEKKYFEKIFEIFQRMPAGQKSAEGTGVGLTIVKRIIEHHGGQIWLKSGINKGTTFFFTLKDKEV